MSGLIRARLSSGSIAVWVLVGAFLGIITGLIFGDYCAILAPVGSAYVMMLQAVVYPYIICLILLGIGQLSREKCVRLFKHSWPFYVAAFGLTLGIMFVLRFGFTPSPQPAAIDPSQPVRYGTDLLHILIPANIFSSLTHDYLPGVIVFAIVFGIAIQRLKGKTGFLQVINVVRDGCSSIIHWILRLSPFGVFAILSKTAGTTEPSALSGLVLYLVLFFGGVVLLVFWLLPSFMAALTPFGYKEIMKEMKSSLVLSGTTAISVAALPFVRQTALTLVEKAQVNGDDRDEVVETSISVSYVVAHLGNLVIYFFILFALHYFKVNISNEQFFLLPFLSAISSMGAASSTFNALAFLQSWLGLPEGASQLYLETFAVTRFGQTLLSVTGFAFITLLSTLSYYGKLRIHPRRLVACILGLILFLSLFAALLWSLRGGLHTKMPAWYPSFTLAEDAVYGVDAKIYRSRDAWERDKNRDDIRPGEPTLQRIERTKKLRVGYCHHYSNQAAPFAYFNKESQLVGYDIAYAYDLARSLNVKLEFIPFEWENLTEDLKHQRMDIVMSGSYVTEERLKTITVSQPYFQSPTALIVPSRKADSFMSASTIKTLSRLKVAVLNAPVGRSFVRRILPGAEIVVLGSYDELPEHPDVDAALWTFVQGSTWAALHPGYTAVVPKNLGSVMMFAYMMPPESADLARFVNYWLNMRKADGFEKRQRDYWIMCKPRQDRKHRWCVIRNVLHWVD